MDPGRRTSGAGMMSAEHRIPLTAEAGVSRVVLGTSSVEAARNEAILRAVGAFAEEPPPGPAGPAIGSLMPIRATSRARARVIGELFG